MHPEAFAFVHAATTDLNPAWVVEFGSRDVNGSPRCFYPDARYVGIDIEAGPGVDVVADAATWIPDRTYDLALCLEVAEHTPDWRGIIVTAAVAVAGTFVLTAACDPRTPHSAIDGGYLRAGEHYANIDPLELGTALEGSGFSDIKVWVSKTRGDVYATGRHT